MACIKLPITSNNDDDSMFTGIIECIGTITRIHPQGTSIILSIRPGIADFAVSTGGSVAVDGACLTLENRTGSEMQFSAVAETLRKTTLASIQAGDRVNLERAVPLGGRLDGHFVYGHIDGIGTIVNDRDTRGSMLRTISVPETLSPYLAEKGSVAIDGISLTIAQTGTAEITLSLIPHSMSVTTLSQKHPGDNVNIECDIIARYLHRIFIQQHPGAGTRQKASGSLHTLMERSGF